VSINNNKTGNDSEQFSPISGHDETTEFQLESISCNEETFEEKCKTSFVADFVQNQNFYFREEKTDYAGIQNNNAVDISPESDSNQIKNQKLEERESGDDFSIQNSNNGTEKLDKNRDEVISNPVSTFFTDLNKEETTDVNSNLQLSNTDSKKDDCSEVCNTLNKTSNDHMEYDCQAAVFSKSSKVENHQNDPSIASNLEIPESDPIFNKSDVFKDSECCLPIPSTAPNQEDSIQRSDTENSNTNPEDICPIDNVLIDNIHFKDDSDQNNEENLPTIESENNGKEDVRETFQEFQSDLKTTAYHDLLENSSQIFAIETTAEKYGSTVLTHDSLEEQNVSPNLVPNNNGSMNQSDSFEKTEGESDLTKANINPDPDGDNDPNRLLLQNNDSLRVRLYIPFPHKFYELHCKFEELIL